MYYADPNNLEAAQHLIVAYQRLGLGSQEVEIQRSKPKIRKLKWKAITGAAEISDERIDSWIDGLLSELRDDDPSGWGLDGSGWFRGSSSDRAEHLLTSIMSGDTLVLGLAWRYTGTHTWYISFDVGKRSKHYWGERTFKPETQNVEI